MRKTVALGLLGIMIVSCAKNQEMTDQQKMQEFDFAVFEEKTIDVVVQNDLGEFIQAPILLTDGPKILGYGVTDINGEIHMPISWHAGMDLEVHVGNNDKVDVGDLNLPVGLTYNAPKTATHKTETIVDSDGDGVTDSLDIDPNDARFVSYASASGRFMFEDIYPWKGDYDFNDVVVDYQVDGYLDGNGDVRKVLYFFTPKNSGAGNANKLSFQLGEISNSDISALTDSTSFEDVIVKASNDAKWELTPNFSNLDGVGIVDTVSETFTYSQDIFRVVRYEHKQSYIPYYFPETVYNQSSYTTYSHSHWSTIDSIADVIEPGTMIISFELPSGYTMADVSGNNIDPFITTATGEDVHIKSVNSTYADETGMPFGVNVPQEVMWPDENEDITEKYSNFTAWATSNGTTNQNWWE